VLEHREGLPEKGAGRDVTLAAFSGSFTIERVSIMGLILLIILILLLLGGLPTWGYSRNWGYGPSGGLGLLVVILLLLLLFNVIPWGHPL
jgi:hypothetical protein